MSSRKAPSIQGGHPKSKEGTEDSKKTTQVQGGHHECVQGIMVLRRCDFEAGIPFAVEAVATKKGQK